MRRAAQLPGEVPGPAADVGDHPAGQVRVLAELAGGVAGQDRVVRVRGHLLGAERPQQPDRPGHVRPEGGLAAAREASIRPPATVTDASQLD